MTNESNLYTEFTAHEQHQIVYHAQQREKDHYTVERDGQGFRFGGDSQLILFRTDNEEEIQCACFTTRAYKEKVVED